jgi:hypothetical protein
VLQRTRVRFPFLVSCKLRGPAPLNTALAPMSLATQVLVAAIIVSPISARACSFPQPEPVEIGTPAPDAPKEAAPRAPLVVVESIGRGYRGKRADSCADTGVVTLVIDVDEVSRGVVYDFREISGRADDIIFEPGAVSGGYGVGKVAFVFPWIDGATHKQEPLDLVVRVTALTRSGVVGGFTDVHLRHPGR